jgi:hypothetical protein
MIEYRNFQYWEWGLKTWISVQVIVAQLYHFSPTISTCTQIIFIASDAAYEKENGCNKYYFKRGKIRGMTG